MLSLSSSKCHFSIQRQQTRHPGGSRRKCKHPGHYQKSHREGRWVLTLHLQLLLKRQRLTRRRFEQFGPLHPFVVGLRIRVGVMKSERENAAGMPSASERGGVQGREGTGGPRNHPSLCPDLAKKCTESVPAHGVPPPPPYDPPRHAPSGTAPTPVSPRARRGRSTR